MKAISCLSIMLAISLPSFSRAQDAATEERLNKLSGQIEDLLAAKAEQNKRISALVKELESLREQSSKPNAAYASQEELKHLAEKVQEIDKNREHDKDLILKEIGKLGKTLPGSVVTPKRSAPAAASDSPGSGSEKPATPEKGYEYTIKSGDNLSTIVRAYREQNIKITIDQILKANPGLKAEQLRPGQKIFIPTPQ